MSNSTGLYVNHILRGVQQALDTTKRGQELIRLAEDTYRNAAWNKMWHKPIKETNPEFTV